MYACMHVYHINEQQWKNVCIEECLFVECFFIFTLEFISRTISANVSLTLIDSLADVSIYGHIHDWARASASSGVTCRWTDASHLFPMRHMGTLSVPLTRRICSRIVRISRNDCHDVRLNTTRKPRPFFM